MSFKKESLWIVGALILGFILSAYLHSKGEATQAKSVALAFFFSCMACFIAVLIRFHGGAIGLGFLEKRITVKKWWIVCAVLGALVFTIVLFLTIETQELRTFWQFVVYGLLPIIGGIILWHVSLETQVIRAKSTTGIILNIIIVLALGIIAIFGFLIFIMAISGG